MVCRTIGFARKSGRNGYFQLPYSRNLGAWVDLMILITAVNGGKGRKCRRNRGARMFVAELRLLCAAAPGARGACVEP